MAEHMRFRLGDGEFWIQKQKEDGLELWDVTEKTDNGIFRNFFTFEGEAKTKEEERKRLEAVLSAREWYFSERPFKVGNKVRKSDKECVHALLMDFCKKAGYCDYAELIQKVYGKRPTEKEMEITKQFAEWQGVEYPENWNLEAVNWLLHSLRELDVRLEDALIKEIEPYYTLETALESLRDVYYKEAEKVQEKIKRLADFSRGENNLETVRKTVVQELKRLASEYEEKSRIRGERGIVASYLCTELRGLISRVSGADTPDRTASILEDFAEELGSDYDRLVSEYPYLSALSSLLPAPIPDDMLFDCDNESSPSP